MSTPIFEIENNIISMIKEITDYTNIHLGTPQSYLSAYDNELPCILVSYSGTKPLNNGRLYPGLLTFTIYFIHHRDSRKIIYELMQDVFNRLQSDSIMELNSALQLQSDQFHYEDSNYLIFTQQWGCSQIV